MAVPWVWVFNGTKGLDFGLLSTELHKCHKSNIALKHLTEFQDSL